MRKAYKNRLFLLSLLLLASGISLYTQTRAEEKHRVIFQSKSTYYTPGQQKNCKWVMHISDEITTVVGDTSQIQIGIPETSDSGYIPGVIQSGPSNSIILALKLPTKSKNIPPVIMTSYYKEVSLPLISSRFRISNSTIMTMVIYNSYERCIEALKK